MALVDETCVSKGVKAENGGVIECSTSCCRQEVVTRQRCEAKMRRKLTRLRYTKTKNPLPEDDGCDAPRDDQSSEAATQLSRWPIR